MKLHKWDRESGFTLVELMITTSIVGILSAVAIPSFQRYLMDTRMAEGVSYAGHIRQDQQSVYLSSMASDNPPSYSDRFVSLHPTKPALHFRVSSGSKFDVIVGSQQASAGFIEGEAIAQSNLPGNGLNSEWFAGNRNNGNFGIQTGTNPSWRAGIIGNLNTSDDFLTVLVTTKKTPLIMACDEFSKSSSPSEAFVSAMNHSDSNDLEGLDPGCTATTQAIVLGGSAEN